MVSDRNQGFEVFDLSSCVLVFEDDFESHDTSHWSAVVPRADLGLHAGDRCGVALRARRASGLAHGHALAVTPQK